MTTIIQIKIPVTLLGLALLISSMSVGASNENNNEQFETNTWAINQRLMADTNNKTLVIYFSRSGNTEHMAREIAKYYQAQLIQLDAADYRPGFVGLVNAVKDSRSKHANITPKSLDVSPYQTIFIGSPIWRYSPAPPVWQFVENNNLVDKNIVLFTTFNSSFEQKHINEFQAQVEDKGGHFVQHIYVKRGRITQKINAQTLSEKTRQALNNLQFQQQKHR